MFSCYLIGEDSLLIQCGEILLSKHYLIELVVSPVKSIQMWAEKNHIEWVAAIDDMLTSHSKKIDYIFSIVNSFILKPAVLQLAHIETFNYHDALLPKYAGLNATTWALVHGEKMHGISWHKVNEGIDEGDIVKQIAFPIHPEDTAFTLNLRCYEYAITAFEELIVAILQGNILSVKQDLKQKSYFGRTALLPNCGFIDWDNFSAEFITQLCKATTLGHYNNNVGFVKLYLKGDYVIVPQVFPVNQKFNPSPPGRVLAITSNHLYLSTITKPIKIENILSKTGQKLTIESLMLQYNLTTGMQCPLIQVDSDAIKRLNVEAIQNESYWIKQFCDSDEHTTFTPMAFKRRPYGGLKQLNTPIYLPQDYISATEEIQQGIMLTAVLIYLYRLNNYEKTSLSLVYPGYKNLNAFGGLFSSFLPLVTDWDAELRLEELLNKVQEQLHQHYKAQTFSTDIIARHPILENKSLTSNIVINLTENNIALELPEETMLFFQYHAPNNALLVSHSIDENYHSGFLKELISNLPQHITNILGYLVHKPHVRISEFCFLTPCERNTLINWGNGSTYPLPLKSISSLFEHHVRVSPDALAIVTQHDSVTYKELDQKAEQVAYTIQKQGIKSQSFIGIYLPRSIEMLAVILGILKADCVYVPLDTKYPLLKIEVIAREAQLNHIVTCEQLHKTLVDFFEDKQLIQCYSYEYIKKIYRSENGSYPHVNRSNTNKLAYIMFTSGTTGIPKGVVVTQENVLNYCAWFTQSTNFSSKSIIDFSSSIAFDLSIPCTIAPLLQGGCIALCNESVKTNPERYLKHLIKHKVTHAELTPGYVEMLLHYPLLVQQLMDLQFLMLGADVVHTEEVRKWLELCPKHKVVNEYGPTETTVSVTSYCVNSDEYHTEASVPIGRPALNSSAYLLDDYKNLCPIGMKGELYVGGAQVTSGYLRKPELTATKFIPLAFNKQIETLYRTGDLAAWLPGGNIQFFGRNDFQVKIQGYRIELPAIESMLLQMRGIEQAVVVMRKGNFKENYLRAYLVLGNTQLSLNEIKSFMSSNLASYMIPKEFCTIATIPLKENEKINFVALESQPCTLLSFDQKIDDTISDEEKVMMSIWNHAFNSADINHHDDFFELGGDSLIALHIINELKQHYQIDIPLSYLFEYPTMALLRTQINKRLKSNVQCQIKNEVDRWIVPLGSGSNSTPLFIVHPVGGSIFWYQHIAAQLTGLFTIYGIQDASIDGNTQRFKSLEDMAQFYIYKMLAIYPGDIFALAGASFGATVAFEMARQLLNLGKSVCYLGLFDGWAYYPETLMKKNTASLLHYQEKGVIDSLIQLEEYRKKLLLNYQPSPIKTNAILYKAEELWQDFIPINKYDNGWSSLIDGHLMVNLMPGNHETMFFKPNSNTLATSIYSNLSQAIQTNLGDGLGQAPTRNLAKPWGRSGTGTDTTLHDWERSF